jgi:superfamily II DNA helicase RecQ
LSLSSDFLVSKFAFKFNLCRYRAGQEPADRARTQAQFFNGSVRVVVATVVGLGRLCKLNSADPHRACH